jgi:hypothetical protein
MKKLFALSLLAATALLPVATQAQNGGGVYSQDRYDDRDDPSVYRSGQRNDTRGYGHDERDEHREARWDYRDNDRDWRGHDHGRGHHDDRGRWSRGDHDRYAYNDGRRSLPYAEGPFRWVRRGSDALLIDRRTDRVQRVIRGYYW